MIRKTKAITDKTSNSSSVLPEEMPKLPITVHALPPRSLVPQSPRPQPPTVSTPVASTPISNKVISSNIPISVRKSRLYQKYKRRIEERLEVSKRMKVSPDFKNYESSDQKITRDSDYSFTSDDGFNDRGNDGEKNLLLAAMAMTQLQTDSKYSSNDDCEVDPDSGKRLENGLEQTSDNSNNVEVLKSTQ